MGAHCVQNWSSWARHGSYAPDLAALAAPATTRCLALPTPEILGTHEGFHIKWRSIWQDPTTPHTLNPSLPHHTLQLNCTS